MGTKPSKLRHLLHQQKYSSNKNYSPQLNLKKNKLIILKRAVAGASYTAATKWKNNNNRAGSIIELIGDIELNEYKQNEENIEIEEANKLKEENEVINRARTYSKLDEGRIPEFSDKARARVFNNAGWGLPAKTSKTQILTKYSIIISPNITELNQIINFPTKEKYQKHFNIQKHQKTTTTLSELAQMQKEMDKALNLLKTKLQKLEEEQRNCTEYLRGFEALINTIQREQQQCNVEARLAEWLRRWIYDLMGKPRVGSNPAACDDEQMNDSPYVMDELWGFVIEELRVDCAEAFEIVMVARTVNNTKNNYSEEIREEKRQKVEELKYLIGSIICALWLQITPYEHDEFEQIKELFLNTLDRYYIISTTERIKNENELLQDKNEIELKKSIRAVLR
uniref:Uncharacterized protein n=1 Tax=Meloidogyne javanica TaxID=6303 RepID=A0A915M236_MELJA